MLDLLILFTSFATTYCFEDPTDMCGLLSGTPQGVFNAVRAPLESQLVGYSLVILWGGLIGIIWFKTENIMLMGIVGLVVSATIVGMSETAKGIGLLLIAVSIGFTLYQLVRQRISIYT